VACSVPTAKATTTAIMSVVINNRFINN